MTATITRHAKISDDGLYRYALLRRWGDGPFVTFVMLNPSTADAEQDDPTIRRCIGFARSWGYDAVHVLNLFAYRATDPKALTQVSDPIGPENDDYLARHGTASVMVAAWGAHPLAAGRAADLRKRLFARWRALGVTKDGHPRHPLYVKADAVLTDWPSA